MTKAPPPLAVHDLGRRVARARPLYFDHHASTPIDPRVARAAWRATLSLTGNANSAEHWYGERARAAEERAARRVARLVDADPEDVVFTGGATEALTMALGHALDRARILNRGRAGSAPRVVASTVEHPALRVALLDAARDGRCEVVWVDVDARGRVQLAALEQAVASGADLVAVMAANNEVGTVQPVARVAAAAARCGAPLLVDATQAAGHVRVAARTWGVAYLVLAGHKLYGPKGVGALVVRAGGERPSTHGTPNTPAVVAFGLACALRRREMAEDGARVAGLRDRLEAALLAVVPGLVVNGDRARRLPGTLHVSAPGAANDVVVARLYDAVALSTGAACASGAGAPSHVLRAMGLSDEVQASALRLSLGIFTTADEVDRAAPLIADAIAFARQAPGGGPGNGSSGGSDA